ncbi:MAG: hypothetical protein H7X80_11150 [bacterium]|nr:hypothetical protein [Candidatus Kapabacteria bacterium]
MKRLFILLALLVATGSFASSQTPGEPVRPGSATEPRAIPSDTLFLFTPARPLVDSSASAEDYDDALGFDILFSNSGFGVGGFYQRPMSDVLAWFVNLGMTGSRKSDEFATWVATDDEYGRKWDIPGKVNRVFSFPLTVGMKYRVLENALVENFRPYVNAGVGPTMILALPYEYDFFSSFGHARAYFTAGGFVGAGADFGAGQPSLGVNVRYYYIPFATGVESLKGEPITQFGGIFLTANIGFFR